MKKIISNKMAQKIFLVVLLLSISFAINFKENSTPSFSALTPDLSHSADEVVMEKSDGTLITLQDFISNMSVCSDKKIFQGFNEDGTPKCNGNIYTNTGNCNLGIKNLNILKNTKTCNSAVIPSFTPKSTNIKNVHSGRCSLKNIITLNCDSGKSVGEIYLNYYNNPIKGTIGGDTFSYYAYEDYSQEANLTFTKDDEFTSSCYEYNRHTVYYRCY